MKSLIRSGRLAEDIKKNTSEFIARESNYSSLITVTRVILNDSLKSAQILITVYPEDKKDEVLDFLKRQRTNIRDYLMKKIRSRIIPFIDFFNDEGEKNRQRLDELSQ